MDAEKLAELGLQPFRGPQVSTEQKVKRFLKTQATRSQAESTNWDALR